MQKFTIVLKGSCSRWLPVPREFMLGPITYLHETFSNQDLQGNIKMTKFTLSRTDNHNRDTVA